MSEVSIDKGVNYLRERTSAQEFKSIWERYEFQKPQCGFGQLGLCCRVCIMGPCRISPFSDGPTRGTCGADADTIAARNLSRMIAAGAAAHSDHGRSIVQTLLLTAQEKVKGYEIKDEEKLKVLAEELKISVEGKSKHQIAQEVAEKFWAEFGQQTGECYFTHRAPQKRQELWRAQGIIPRGIDREVVEMMHRTNMGVDTELENLIRHGFRTALSDGWAGSMIATELSDVLFGSPRPLRAVVNLGVLKEDEVNIVVHGHEPVLSEVIVEAAQDAELIKLAHQYGAKGINLAGICCTANEVLMRHGIPIAGNFLHQELAIMTGAVELMAVDVQCIMPSLSYLSECFHTKLISTSSKAKFPNVQHIEFHEEEALEIAKRIIRLGVENFPARKKERVVIPKEKMDLIAGFTAESVFRFLGGKYRATYRPLNDAIIAGRLRGLAGVVGCNHPKIKQDWGHVTLVKELIKHDVLVVVTGCSAIANAKAGLLQPEAAFSYAGKGLQEICEAVGIPPVLHVGSCVDNSRILIALCHVLSEGGLGEDFSDLPVAAAAPEWMSEKAVSIGFYAVGSGIFTVLGNPFPVLGSPKVTKFLCEDLEKLVGAKFAFEGEPIKAAHLIIEHLNQKREALKLKPMMYS
jgi:carbon-monoxide dehydrogenase catalytic subunit